MGIRSPRARRTCTTDFGVRRSFLLVSAVTLAYAAYDSNFTGAFLPIIGVNILGAGLFIALGLGSHSVLLKLPGAYLMGGTALLAWLGVQ